MSDVRDGVKMPKWLLYGLIAKGALLALIIVGVTIWLGGR